jgi:hypothetical protein
VTFEEDLRKSRKQILQVFGEYSQEEELLWASLECQDSQCEKVSRGKSGRKRDV